jgi:ABC-2 type transport system ATP-binding protein
MPRSRKEVRRQLGYMPERSIVSPRISAVSFLTYCGCLFGMNRVDAMERAHEVLNYVGVGENRYRNMETYSTGMCQRVKFAQALIHNPRLLLLDEPTNGLDPEGRVEMLELIRELAIKREMAILLSSHLMPDVQHVCDRVVVLNKGEVVRDGSISDLTALRDGLYEVRVRDDKKPFVAALEEAGCSCSEQQNGNVLVEKPANFAIGSFFEIARSQNTQVRYLKPVRKRLEEVFMEAIGNGGPINRQEAVGNTPERE